MTLTQAIREELKTFGTATIHEAMGQSGAAYSGVKPIDPTMKCCGRAFTVLAQPGDNLVLHEAIYKAGEGDVLLVETGDAQWGYWGEVMSCAAQARGIEALVIDGGVRDTEQIIGRRFPVFAANICIRGTMKRLPGRMGGRICFGGVYVEAGDVIVGDRDGVVVIPEKQLEQTILSCRARVAKEALLMEELNQGRTTLDLLCLQVDAVYSEI